MAGFRSMQTIQQVSPCQQRHQGESVPSFKAQAKPQAAQQHTKVRKI